MWFTAMYRHPEALDDQEGERVVGHQEVCFEVGKFLDYIGSDEDIWLFGDDSDGPIGERVQISMEAQVKALAHYNSQGCKFEIRANGSWYCFDCAKPLQVRKKDDIVKHLSTLKHKNAVMYGEMRTQYFANAEFGVDVGQELTEMMVSSNIPLYKLRQGRFRAFLQGFTQAHA